MNINRYFAEIWYASVDEVLEYYPESEYRNVLSDEECQRQDGLLYERDKRAFYAAHVFKRNVLSKYAPIAPDKWRFIQGKYGRPEVASGLIKEHLFFNISHRPDEVVCLVSNLRECGVDLEDSRRKVDFPEVAENVFAKSEQDYCFGEKAEIRKRFFPLWCLKEAYMKALGLGFHMDPKSFSFSIEGKEISLDNHPGWHFQLHNIGGNFIIAVALHTAEKLEIKISKYKP